MIKVTVGEQKTQINSFPKLMINKDNDKTIIIAIDKHGEYIEGFCVVSTMKQEGVYSKKFIADCFEDYNGSITLSNEYTPVTYDRSNPNNC